MFPESRVLLLFGRTGDRDCYSNRAGRHSQKWSKFHSTLQELRANKAFVIVIVIHIQIRRHKASPSWSTFQHKIWKSESIQTDLHLWIYQKCRSLNSLNTLLWISILFNSRLRWGHNLWMEYSKIKLYCQKVLEISFWFFVIVIKS